MTSFYAMSNFSVTRFVEKPHEYWLFRDFLTALPGPETKEMSQTVDFSIHVSDASPSV